MSSSWILTILGIVFFLVLLLAILLIASILLGLIKPTAKKNNNTQPDLKNKNRHNPSDLPIEIGTPALGRALFSNSPKERWGYQDIEVGQEIIRVPFPDFHWWQLLDPKYSETLDLLTKEMMEKWKGHFSDSHIYAASSAAYYLLRQLSSWLAEIGAEVIIPDPDHEVSAAEKVIIFDIYTTTGQALVRAQRNLPKGENGPTHYLVLIFNDLVPSHEGPSTWWLSNIPHQQYECLYFAGDYVKYWRHHDDRVLDALSVIRDAFRGIKGWDWNSQRAREAIETLQTVLQSPQTSKK